MVGLIRRAGAGLATLFGVALLTFLVMSALPGDPLAAFVSPESLSRLDADERAVLERRHGLDRPVVERFAMWAASVLRGDLGRSLRSGERVTDEIARRLIPTVELNLAALALALGLGVPFGWWTAHRGDERIDRWGHAALVALYAMPFFWLALILQNAFALEWRLLPLFGRTPATGATDLATRASHLVLPATSLALHIVAFYARIARDASISGSRSAFASVARASGVGEARVFVQHGIRPSFVPLATLLGILVPTLVSGSVIIERIFRWPGLGSYFVSAVIARDVPVVAGLTLITGALTILGSFTADALTWLADPRRRRAGHGE